MGWECFLCKFRSLLNIGDLEADGMVIVWVSHLVSTSWRTSPEIADCENLNVCTSSLGLSFDRHRLCK